MVIAYEDIGLGNPAAAARTVTAVRRRKLGFPEARIPLASVVIDLCLSPKSNSAVTAIDLLLWQIFDKALWEMFLIIYVMPTMLEPKN